MQRKYLIIGTAALLFLFLLVPGSVAVDGNTILNSAAELIGDYEGFRASPYWDVSRYSWGYGTAAPGSTGTITPGQALADMKAVILHDYGVLSSMVTVSLSPTQWAALLSFSYNLGVGDAQDLVPIINSGDASALQNMWMQYVHAGGVVNQDLVTRRNYEWQIWNS